MNQILSENRNNGASNDKSSLDWLCDRINDWVEENHKKDKIVEFYGGFWTVDPEKNFDVVDDRIIVYGIKESILLSIKEQTKMIKKEKEEFINW